MNFSVKAVGIIPVLVLAVTQLHLVRNATSLYLPVYGFVFLLSIAYIFLRWSGLSRTEKDGILFVTCLFFTPVLSLPFGVLSGAYSGMSDIALGVSRLMFSLPIYFVVLASAPDNKAIRSLFVFASLFSLCAALSIPYQFSFGPVGWFAESSERSGLSRFASLFGSLTALGIVCGYALSASFVAFRSKFVLSLVCAGIVIGSILSLQKAAIINLLIAAVFLAYAYELSFLNILKSFSIFAVCFSFFFVGFSEEISTIFESMRFFAGSEGLNSDDVSLQESIVERLVELPSVAIDYHGVWSLIYGHGPVGGSGSLGFPEVPMSHNGLVDLFLIGGLFYFLLFVVFFVWIFVVVKKRYSSSDSDLFFKFGVFVLLAHLVNIPFSGLPFFPPSNALFMALALKCVLLKR